jgi:hypothetical protein
MLASEALKGKYKRNTNGTHLVINQRPRERSGDADGAVDVRGLVVICLLLL